MRRSKSILPDGTELTDDGYVIPGCRFFAGDWRSPAQVEKQQQLREQMRRGGSDELKPSAHFHSLLERIGDLGVRMKAGQALLEASAAAPILERKDLGMKTFIGHSNIRNKTITVGESIFVFDGEGCAKVGQNAWADAQYLLRKPGFFIAYARIQRELDKQHAEAQSKAAMNPVVEKKVEAAPVNQIVEIVAIQGEIPEPPNPVVQVENLTLDEEEEVKETVITPTPRKKGRRPVR